MLIEKLAVPKPVEEGVSVLLEEAVPQRVTEAEPQKDCEIVGERDWVRLVVKLLVAVPQGDCDALSVPVIVGVKLAVPLEEAVPQGVDEAVPQAVSDTVGDRD